MKKHTKRMRQLDRKFRSTTTHTRSDRGPVGREYTAQVADHIKSFGSVDVNAPGNRQVTQPTELPDTVGMLRVNPTPSTSDRAICVDEVSREWQSEIRRQGMDKFHRIIIKEGTLYRLSVWFFASDFLFIEEDHRIKVTRKSLMYHHHGNGSLMKHTKRIAEDVDRIHWSEVLQR